MDIIAMIVCAIMAVESSNGANLKRGDGGRAVGPYQMWRVAVDEANRIESIYAKRYGRNARQWHYSDRTCPVKSREMCELTLMWHHKRGTKNPVILACKWNKPYGKIDWKYYNKIKKVLKNEK